MCVCVTTVVYIIMDYVLVAFACAMVLGVD